MAGADRAMRWRCRSPSAASYAACRSGRSARSSGCVGTLTVDARTTTGWRDDGVVETSSELGLLIASDKRGVANVFANQRRHKQHRRRCRCHAPGAIWKLWRWCRKSRKSWRDSDAAWRACHAPRRRRNTPIMRRKVVGFVVDAERCHAPGEKSFAAKPRGKAPRSLAALSRATSTLDTNFTSVRAWATTRRRPPRSSSRS